jgi:MYXO-CTERM domain-containing protein
MIRAIAPVGLTVTLLLAAAPLARRAEACSAPYPGLSGRALYPADGTSGVPLNARIAVRYRVGHELDNRFPPLGPDIALRVANGAAVAVTSELIGTGSYWNTETLVILRPSQPLAAGTSYEVLDRRSKIPCDIFANDCALGDPAVFARFATGAASDTVAPQFAGLSPLIVGAFDRCDSSACCGPYVSRSFGMTWTRGQDDVAGQAVRYNLYRVGDAGPIASLIDSDGIGLAVSCMGTGVYPQSLMVRTGTYFVRAVDWAGNEDINDIQVRVPDDACTGSSTDGGSPTDADEGFLEPGAEPSDGGGARDSGADRASAPAPHRSSGGSCSMGGGGGDDQGTVLPLLIVLGLLGVRRRVERSRARE